MYDDAERAFENLKRVYDDVQMVISNYDDEQVIRIWVEGENVVYKKVIKKEE